MYSIFIAADYSTLAEIIKRIVGVPTTGINLILITRRVIRGVCNWLVLIILKFLIDAVKCGEATTQILDTLSRFVNEISVVLEKLKRRLRPYVMLPYFGAAIVILTSLIVLGMLVRSIQSVMGTSASTLGVMMRISVSASPINIDCI